MTLSSRKPQRRTSDDYEAGRAHRHGLRAGVAALWAFAISLSTCGAPQQESGKCPCGPRPRGSDRDKWQPRFNAR